LKTISILKDLKDKKIDVYVRKLGQYGQFQGVLKDISEEFIILKSRYNRVSYVPISEIVVITEHEVRTMSKLK
jgi:ferredoxin-fold anticodon binding domain-containing protein